MLSFYARRLDSVEINNSFYRLPSRKTFRQWREQTPDQFLFAVKASRYITHMKKLKDPEPALSRFLAHVGELGGKLGVILFQLPPRWHRNVDRLKDFLAALPRAVRCAVEFRDPSWFHPHIYDILRKHNVAFCVFDLGGVESPDILTADFAYLRLHGPAERKYAGCYIPAQLRRWLERSEDWLAQGARQAFIYFDNDQGGYAALNAQAMQAMIARATQ
jgi:uncharacterized protein YecE (DUF72 family)